jgi:hypothetical protein
MRAKPVLGGWCILVLLAIPFAAGSQEANQGFLTVRQILESNCLACHDWAASHEGIADPSRVTPGAPDQSPLYTMVSSDAMPMGGDPLPVTQKSLLRAWIASGATASEEPLSLELPEASGQTGGITATPSPAPARRFNKVRFHQVSGFTSASLFLAAGAIGTVQWGTMMSAGHEFRDANGIEDYENSTACADYLMDLWNDPEHQAWRWTHVGLLGAGESLYLANAITGWSMRTKDRAGLSAQDLHRYGFFIHGSLMVAQIIMGVFTTEVLSSGNHEAMIGLGIAHTAVGFTIPLAMIASGITVNRMLKL